MMWPSTHEHMKRYLSYRLRDTFDCEPKFACGSFSWTTGILDIRSLRTARLSEASGFSSQLCSISTHAQERLIGAIEPVLSLRVWIPYDPSPPTRPRHQTTKNRISTCDSIMWSQLQGLFYMTLNSTLCRTVAGLTIFFAEHSYFYIPLRISMVVALLCSNSILIQRHQPVAGTVGIYVESHRPKKESVIPRPSLVSEVHFSSHLT